MATARRKDRFRINTDLHLNVEQRENIFYPFKVKPFGLFVYILMPS